MAAPSAGTPVRFGPYIPTASVDAAIVQWRLLRQGGNFPFATYAAFLNSNPGFPGDSSLRKAAEKALRSGEYPATVAAFFAIKPPTTGNGWARLTEARAALGRPDTLDAARSAWASGDLDVIDEANLLARYAGQLTAADHDRRADALLFAKKPGDALRLVGLTSPARRAALVARIAMQQGSPDAEAQYAAVRGLVASDAGLLMDRARYLRDGNNSLGARSLFAQPHRFTERPADVERFTDMMVQLARGAAADSQWSLAYNIARQLDDLYPAGTDITAKDYAVRDNYTTLAWLAGATALDRLGRPADAVPMFDRYAHGGRSLQVASKGNYWAARAAARAGQLAQSERYYQQAAATPELFYGQLALEKLGRVAPQPSPTPPLAVTDMQRRAFENRRLVAATRQLAVSRFEQSLFIRALAESLDNDSDRLLAAQLAPLIGRPDLAVWTERSARNNGSRFFYRAAYPTHGYSSATGRLWSLAHGITRQESSFDRAIVSPANAVGMMQLLPSTAAEQAGKMGVGFDRSRLTSDPAYNVMLGTAYFQRLLDNWGGSYPLAVASYNAGAGNVRKWVNAYGDPRSGAIDMLSFIERIPFEETRGYVQRVLEGSVVYDSINPTAPPASAARLSQLLGQSRQPG